jgi:hypothetical protein
MEILIRKPVRSALLLLTALIAAVTLAACGGDDEDTSSGPDPATVAPATAPIYFEATIKPEGDAKDNLLGTLDKLLGTDDSGAMITDQINAAFEGEDVNFDEDINSWLGSTMGGWVSSFTEQSGEGAAAFAVTDEGAAQEGVDKLAATGGTQVEEREYEGTSYKFADDVAYGIVGDFMVLGTEKGFQEAVDASGGDSLADDSTATDALDSVPDGTLASAYVDVKSAIDAALQGRVITQQDLDQSGVSDQLDSYGDEPVVFSMGAGEDNFSFEASGPAGGSDVEGTDIMTTLPSEAWLAFGAPDVGGRIAEGYQQFVEAFQTGLQSGLGDVQDSLGAQGLKPTDIPRIDVEIEKQIGLDITKDLGWIGNVGGFVQGASIFDLGGGIVIETDDPDAATAALAKLRTALGRERSLKITETEDGGFNIQTADAPVGAEVGIRDDKVVFAFAGATIDDVLEPSETLSDSDTFSSADSALGDDLDPSFYLDLAPILSLVESSGGSSDPDYAMAAPYLSAIDYLIAGGGVSDDRATGRFVIGVQEQTESSSDTAAATITP